MATDYDGLVIPGGFSPDYMRRNKATLKFVEEMDKLEKPIAAICHGPWILASAANIKGKKITAYPSIKDDVVNAGALWQEKTLVVDRHYVTAQSPRDLPKFVVELVKLIEK